MFDSIVDVWLGPKCAFLDNRIFQLGHFFDGINNFQNLPFFTINQRYVDDCMKSIHIQSFSGLYFPAFILTTDQKNSE